MISFKCFLIKKKKNWVGGWNGKEDWVCTCVPEGCSLLGVETVFFRLHLKGEVKTCSVEGITVLRCSGIFHATRIHEFALSHFKGEKKGLYFLNPYTHGLGGERWGERSTYFCF